MRIRLASTEAWAGGREDVVRYVGKKGKDERLILILEVERLLETGVSPELERVHN